MRKAWISIVIVERKKGGGYMSYIEGETSRSWWSERETNQVSILSFNASHIIGG